MKALLVDGFNLVRRIYAAVPEPPEEASQFEKDDHIQGVINSIAASMQRALKAHHPSHCVAVFEQSGRTWRHRLFPDYKKKRSEMPAPLAAAMEAIKQSLAAMGVNSFEFVGYEADDVIATMATKISHNNGDAIILSTDRNHCQLLNEHIRVYDHFGQRYLDRDIIYKRFGVEPEDLPLLLALAGDSGLSIPGIAGVGIRTAARLVNEFGTLEKMMEASVEMKGKIGAKIFNGREDAEMGLKLFTLKTDIELGINLNQFRIHPEVDSRSPPSNN